jgi:RimJ/RimL family protein N-acetyltransferase
VPLVPDDPAFETERLRARRWRIDDAEAAYAIYSRPEVTRYLGAAGRPVESLEAQRAGLERILKAYDERPGFGGWALELRDDGTLLGSVLLKPLPAAEEIEVGWHLAPDHWGHGYATEAGAGAIAYGWRLGLDEIYAIVRVENDPSKRVARRLGMTSLGLTDRYYGVEAELFRIARADEPIAPAGPISG